MNARDGSKMIKIAALNEESEDDDSPFFQQEIATKEAQEEEAIALYNRALKLQNDDELEAAEKVFNQLLQLHFVAEAKAEGPVNNPILMLKYSSYKNLGNIATRRGNPLAAAEAYLSAVDVDSTDVSLWYRIGVVAKKMHKYPLARFAFERGLECNPNHWSSLDNVITVLYVQNDYEACLYYISRALERESRYTKGLAIRDQIYREHPALRMDFVHLFKFCDENIFGAKYDTAEGETFVKEALALRAIKRDLEKPPEPTRLALNRPLESKTWKGLGENIVALYDRVKKTGPPLSLTCVVDMTRCPDTEAADGPDGSDVASELRKDAEPLPVEENAATEREGTETAEPVNGVEGTPEASKSQRKGRKRKLAYLLEYSELAEKRRSARVRNTSTRKQAESVDYTTLLRKFLPSSLMACGQASDMATSEPTSESEATTASESDANAPVFMDEAHHFNDEEEVMTFIKNNDGKSSLMEILYNYLIALGRKSFRVWSEGLPRMCYEVFKRFRRHCGPSSFFCDMSDLEALRDEVMMYFVNCQYEMSSWGEKRNSSETSTSQRSRVGAKDLTVHASEFFSEDLTFLLRMATNESALGEDCHCYLTVVWWMRAHYEILRGDADEAAAWLEAILDHLRQESGDATVVRMSNCDSNNVISAETVNKLLESLQRRQSLEEVRNLYEKGELGRVVDLLVPTFERHAEDSGEGSKAVQGRERHQQLLLLMESLEKLGDRHKYLNWAESSVDEGIRRYLTAPSVQERNDWARTLIRLFDGLEKCVSGDPAGLRRLSHSKMVRLTHNLIRVISAQMETTDSASETPVNSVLPWILLYRLIDQEEKKIKELMTRDRAETEDELSTGIPSPLMLLYNAHQYLGRRSWCCNSDGSLLLLYVDVLFGELRRPEKGHRHPFQEDLERSIEQCFYCLYGHPSRKSRARHLQEHGSPQISLKWRGAEVVYEYFKPQRMPEFDNYKINTVSGELENLLRRMLALVPQDLSPGPLVDKMTAYIDGTSDTVPSFPVEKFQNAPIVRDLFYLLGDYYFKYKEQGKAVKFYLLDVCVNPERFDAWAGMALARSSQLEARLNSCETRSDSSVLKRASAALVCFKRALRLNENCTKLWIEYGSLAYMLHAYCGRQLKMVEQFGAATLFAESPATFRAKRDELLEVASECFENASRRCHEGEEEWLHHYMLGKVAEKTGQHPKEYLFHYRLAAWHLHEDGAAYPKKIPYHNPPHLSLEALEVHYRIHASVLKYLKDHEGEKLDGGTYSLLKTHFRQVAAGPLATFQDKRSCDVEETSPVAGVRRRSHKVNSLANDHDYFRRKRKSSMDSSSESQDSATVKDLLLSLVSMVSDKVDEAPTSPDQVEPVSDFGDLINICVEAMKRCLQRFPQHYKSLYRLAFHYSRTGAEDMSRARDYLLGPAIPWQRAPYMPCQGLFSDRKNTNFFNGIWRIPSDEIDRPGSFNAHMLRSVLLLIDILVRQSDYALLLNLAAQLYRTPDSGKKYLKDSDRLNLAGAAYERGLKTFRERWDSTVRDRPSADNQAVAVKHLLEAYRFWQLLQKLPADAEPAAKAFEYGYTAFVAFVGGRVDPLSPVFEQATLFCQQQQLALRPSPISVVMEAQGYWMARTMGTEGQQPAKDPCQRTIVRSVGSELSGADREGGIREQAPEPSSPSMASVCDPISLTDQVRAKISSLDVVTRNPDVDG